jgi:hypothetical protein
MNDLILNKQAKFNPKIYWEEPIPKELIDYDFIESNKCVKLFDQNGYDLCPLEIEYTKYNLPTCKSYSTEIISGAENLKLVVHRNVHHTSIQTPWFKQNSKLEGYVLNHSMLLERKGYAGKALEQLKNFAKRNPLINKVINIKSKWGLDFSLDYCQTHFLKSESDEIPGETSYESFEVFHHEFDSFKYEDAINMKYILEGMIQTTNFDDVARDLIKRKSQWFNLEFFEQSAWKCNYFKVPNERFKMVVWQ